MSKKLSYTPYTSGVITGQLEFDFGPKFLSSVSELRGGTDFATDLSPSPREQSGFYGFREESE
jgi:hypothetical protein